MEQDYTKLSKGELLKAIGSKDEKIIEITKEHQVEMEKMRNKLNCMKTEFNNKTSEVLCETNKKIKEIEDDVRTFMKIIAKYI